MVDASLIYWEMGKTDEGRALYKRAALLSDPAGQCNLAISYLKAEPPNSTEAVKWLVQSSHAGYVRAQYQLALCLHQGQGVDRNLSEADNYEEEYDDYLQYSFNNIDTKSNNSSSFVWRQPVEQILDTIVF
ncbi:hypothetical protein QQ045_017119 [Rhodiola kirilowii]